MKDQGQEVVETGVVATAPLVFISHDTRDADLAEAFSKLLKSVSAGMIRTFRSSDKKAGEGIAFGEEWYKRLMSQLQITSDVVCLFTENSLDRPWILFEAGVAKGKLETPVVGVALGVPLSRVSAGPFYQFQNMDDSEADLTKLVNQLARRVPGLELDPDVVQAQVKAFKAAEAKIVDAQGKAPPSKKVSATQSEEFSIAKLVEEMKSLPSRVAERLSEDGLPFRRKPMRFHPMMFEELLHFAGEPEDPVGILLVASLVREDMPWLYEISMEIYRAIKSGDPDAAERELSKLARLSEVMMHGPFLEGFSRKEHYLMSMEYPRLLERALRQTLNTQRQAAKPSKQMGANKK